MATSVHDVVAAVVQRHHPIDTLKLQKIVYFAAGEYIALTGVPMFPEPIEAWDYGPVVYDIWHTYRDYEGRKDILEPLAGTASNLNDVEITCIESALAQYGEQSGARLIDVTHLEDAWKDHYVPGHHRTTIPNDALRDSFRAKVADVELPSAMLDALFAS